MNGKTITTKLHYIENSTLDMNKLPPDRCQNPISGRLTNCVIDNKGSKYMYPCKTSHENISNRKINY
jgi:hypothetical protein